MPSDMSSSSRKLFGSNLRWLKFVVPVLVVSAVVVFVVLRPLPVVVHEAKAGTVEAEVMGTGTLAARFKVALSPKIQGRITEVLVDQNDTVRTGQLLARLDEGELLQQVEIARANLAAMRATGQRVRADQARAEAVARLTRLDHQRSSELLATKSIAQSDFDKAVQSLRVAEADLQRAGFAIDEAERLVSAAEKNLLFQEERLADTRLLSPFDGLVVKRNRDPGEVVVPGSAVLDLVATSEIWVSAWVDETAMAGLGVGQPARVIFRSEPGETYAGEVARLGRQTDVETREFIVDVRLSRLPRNWTIGQRAEVFITTGRVSAAATLPVEAVQVREAHAGVFIDVSGRARWRAVETGLRGRDRVEITRGVAPGERVAVPRDARTPLAPGDRIAAR
jgi:HlyD family secretion protein